MPTIRTPIPTATDGGGRTMQDIIQRDAAGAVATGATDTTLTETNTRLGATDDAAAAAGGTGSLTAKLRLTTTLLDAIKTAVELLDNAIAGTEVQVDVVAALPTGANTIGAVTGPTADNAANPTLKLGILPAVALAAAPTRTEGNVNPLRVTLAGDAVVTLDGEAVVLGAGTAEIGKLAAGTANIGDMDVLSIAAGDNNIGNVDVVTLPNVTLAAGTNTNEVVGDVAHDIGVAGNPVLICGAAQDTDDTAPPNRVSAESDATRLATDRDGSLHVLTYGPQVWSYHSNGSTALTDASVHAAPGAGLSLYVTDIVCSLGAATALNIFFEEGATTVLGPWYLEAINGRGLHIKFQTPKKITANTALTVTTSASVAHSVDVTGFTAQG